MSINKILSISQDIIYGCRKMSFMRGITSRLMAEKKWNAEKASFCFCWQKIIEQACDQSNRRYYIYFFIYKSDTF